MRIQFFGAARTVTGSKHLITTEKGTKILLDCGLFQGIQTDEFNQKFGFEPSEVDYLVLSHAHIDHSGLIPRLIKQGFSGPIYCTTATADLCKIMLLDSSHIQEKDLEKINKRRHKQGRPLLEELYNAEDAEKALSLFKGVQYGEKFQLGADNEVSVMFTDAGHILGSAAVHLSIPDKGAIKKLTFTGDIGRQEDNILRKPQVFPQADFIISESTYGDRLHPKENDMQAHLLRVVQETCVEKKGKVIIPAFAIDRTQELIYTLDQLSSSGKLPKFDVYIDSPLAIRATKIMKDHEECFNPAILDYIEKDGDAFAFPNLHYISETSESIALNDIKGPCIIISASGMAEAGRIKHHIKNRWPPTDSGPLTKSTPTSAFTSRTETSPSGGRSTPREDAKERRALLDLPGCLEWNESSMPRFPNVTQSHLLDMPPCFCGPLDASSLYVGVRIPEGSRVGRTGLADGDTRS